MITLKGILIFVTGAAAGAIGSWYCSKRYYEKLIEEMDEYYAGEEAIEYYPDEDAEDPAETEPADTERKGPFATPYNEMYKGEKAEDPAESEHPSEDVETKKDKKNAPRVIKNEEFGNQGFTKVYLDYYFYDQALVVCDETEAKEVDEVKDWIGDALDKFGFSSNDQEVICVRNSNRKCDYQIQKIWESFVPPESY